MRDRSRKEAQHGPIRSPWDEDWPFYSKSMERVGPDLGEWTWGHLPESIKDECVNDLARYREGLQPMLDPQTVEQIAEAMIEQWELFGPALEFVLAKMKGSKKRIK